MLQSYICFIVSICAGSVTITWTETLSRAGVGKLASERHLPLQNASLAHVVDGFLVLVLRGTMLFWRYVIAKCKQSYSACVILT